jgi:hypothetical protein
MTTDRAELARRLEARAHELPEGSILNKKLMRQAATSLAQADEELAKEREGRAAAIRTGKALMIDRQRAVKELTRAQAEIGALRDALRLHHEWHLNSGTIGLPDDNGGWIAMDNAAEYSDSEMCQRTEDALRTSSETGDAVMRVEARADSAAKPEDVQRLADAMWQLLDDMGTHGLDVCLAAKAQARIAYEPFLDEDGPLDWPIEEARRIYREANQG